MKHYTTPIPEIDAFLKVNAIQDKDLKQNSDNLKYSTRSKLKNKSKVIEHSNRYTVRTLDLHNKTVIDAEILISEFINSSLKDNLHNVIIVHGKGLHSEGGIAVLKNLVHRMLNGTFKRFITSTRHLSDRDGGSGATEVFFD